MPICGAVGALTASRGARAAREQGFQENVVEGGADAANGFLPIREVGGLRRAVVGPGAVGEQNDGEGSVEVEPERGAGIAEVADGVGAEVASTGR